MISLGKHWLTKKRIELNEKNFASEKWFKHILKKNIKSNCICFCNKPFLNRFFLDFYFPAIFVGVEIDGFSHKDTKEYDEQRDLSIIKHSIVRVKKIYRIKYGDSEKANEVIKEIIDVLKPFQSVVRKPEVKKENRSVPKKYFTKEMKLKKAQESWERAGLDVKKLTEWFKK